MLMKQQIQEIREKLESYFSTMLLPVLDREETGTTKLKYNGVTLLYIIKYVLLDEYPQELVCYCLMDMLAKREIRLMHCSTINQKVFRSRFNNMWRTFSFNGNRLDDTYNHCNTTKLLEDGYHDINTKLQTEAEMTSA